MTAQELQEGVTAFVNHHAMSDSHSWKLPFLPEIPLTYPLSLHAVMLIITSLLLILAFGVLYKKRDDQAPRGLTNLLEIFVLFIRDQVAEANLGKEVGRRFTPFLCTVFFFLMFANFLGLI